MTNTRTPKNALSKSPLVLDSACRNELKTWNKDVCEFVLRMCKAIFADSKWTLIAHNPGGQPKRTNKYRIRFERFTIFFIEYPDKILISHIRDLRNDRSAIAVRAYET